MMKSPATVKSKQWDILRFLNRPCEVYERFVRLVAGVSKGRVSSTFSSFDEQSEEIPASRWLHVNRDRVWSEHWYSSIEDASAGDSSIET
jgi:hypothetical protein